MNQQAKAEQFRALHQRERAFLIPNPWDAGTARVLDGMGFEAVATTGGGYAFSVGVPDGATTRAGMLGYIRSIVQATTLPVSADLEDGFGDAPEAAAQMILDAADCGVVGGSIEDRSYPRDPARTAGSYEFYAIEHAAERVRAAADAARSLPFPFTLTGRCENFLLGRPDLGDTIARLQAYQEAGADVLYAPGLRTKDEVRAVVTSVDRPVNVIIGRAGDPMSLRDLDELGVRRVSVGSALQRTALGAFIAAAEELRGPGTCTFASGAISHERADELFAPWV